MKTVFFDRYRTSKSEINGKLIPHSTDIIIEQAQFILTNQRHLTHQIGQSKSPIRKPCLTVSVNGMSGRGV